MNSRTRIQLRHFCSRTSALSNYWAKSVPWSKIKSIGWTHVEVSILHTMEVNNMVRHTSFRRWYLSKVLKEVRKQVMMISGERKFQVETNNKPCGGGHMHRVLIPVRKPGFRDDRDQTLQVTGTTAVLLEYSHPHSLVSVRLGSRRVPSEAAWPSKPKTCAVWPLTGKFASLCSVSKLFVECINKITNVLNTNMYTCNIYVYTYKPRYVNIIFITCIPDAYLKHAIEHINNI